MNDELIIQLYGGMTEAQFYDLKRAYEGTLEKINPARHIAMKDLIGNDLKATSVGEKLYTRVRERLILKGDLKPLNRMGDTARQARQVNKGVTHWNTKKLKLTSCHMKVLNDLSEHPGLHTGYLQSIYGWQSVKELEAAGLIRMICFDGCTRWGWYVLEYAAERLLIELKEL